MRRPLLAVMITELPLELVAHQIDRRGYIVSFGMRTEGLSRDPQRASTRLRPPGRGWFSLITSRSRVVARGSILERGEFLLGQAPGLVGHVQAASRERHVHVPGPPVARWALVRLTWSFAPHSPAGALARPPGRPRHRTPALSRSPGAGLTSKPRHAQPPTVALRGSFRPRLASTTGEHPRATTDPDESPPEDRHPHRGGATGAAWGASGPRRPRGPRSPRRREGPRRRPRGSRRS